jgi:hypothetical protein
MQQQKYVFYNRYGLKFSIKITAVADECQTAADIFQCGRQEAPNVTDAIFTKEAGSATKVHF